MLSKRWFSVFIGDLRKNDEKLEFWEKNIGSAGVKEDKGGVKSLLYFLFKLKRVSLRFFQGTVFDLRWL